MNKRQFTYLLILVCITLYSCGNTYKYPADRSISESNGSLADSITTSYIIDSIYFDGAQYINQWDINTKDRINDALKKTGSPILFNYFLNRNIIRVVCLNSDSATSIVDINEKAKEYWLTYKLLEENKNVSMADSVDTSISVRTMNIDQEQWKTIDSLTQMILFEDMQVSTKTNIPNSNPSYFIEYHTKDKYFYYFSDNKDKTLQDLVKYLKDMGHFIKL